MGWGGTKAPSEVKGDQFPVAGEANLATINEVNPDREVVASPSILDVDHDKPSVLELLAAGNGDEARSNFPPFVFEGFSVVGEEPFLVDRDLDNHRAPTKDSPVSSCTQVGVT